MNQLKKELRRFLVAGFSAVGTDMGSYYILIKYISHSPAKATSFILGTGVAYVINKYWTFEKKEHSVAEIARFAMLYLTTLGLFRSKSKNLVKLGQALVRDHGGQVPTTREELKKLPGVGNKTAGVVTIHLGTEHAFPVDTHVFRLARRLGFTRGAIYVDANTGAVLFNGTQRSGGGGGQSAQQPSAPSGEHEHESEHGDDHD